MATDLEMDDLGVDGDGETDAGGTATGGGTAGSEAEQTVAKRLAEQLRQGRPRSQSRVLAKLYEPGVYEIIARMRQQKWTWPEITTALTKVGVKAKEASIRKEIAKMTEERAARAQAQTARRLAAVPTSSTVSPRHMRNLNNYG